jgi:hypothetical protein
MFFPESFYLSNNPNYIQELLLGYSVAKDTNVLICGCVRNCENALIRNFYRINAIRPFFRKLDTFLYENDSDDNTLSIVKKMSTFYQTEKLSFQKHNRDKSLLRRQVMAHARNKYLDFARKIKEYDVLIVMDMDLPGGFSLEGLLHTFSLSFDKRCYGANSIVYDENNRLFFDSWAYRSYESTEEEDSINKLILHRGMSPIRVDSCFGGIGVYPYSMLKEDVRYEDYDCDHVTLHKQLRDIGYKIYINPSMISLYTETYYDKCDYPC